MAFQALHNKFNHLVHHSHYAEHAGFIAYAMAEVFNLHFFLYYVSVWLVVTGVAAIWIEVKE